MYWKKYLCTMDSVIYYIFKTSWLMQLYYHYLAKEIYILYHVENFYQIFNTISQLQNDNFPIVRYFAMLIYWHVWKYFFQEMRKMKNYIPDIILSYQYLVRRRHSILLTIDSSFLDYFPDLYKVNGYLYKI